MKVPNSKEKNETIDLLNHVSTNSEEMEGTADMHVLYRFSQYNIVDSRKIRGYGYEVF